MKRLLGEEHLDTLKTTQHSAVRLWQTGRQQQALLLQHEAFKTFDRLLDNADPALISAKETIQFMLENISTEQQQKATI